MSRKKHSPQKPPSVESPGSDLPLEVTAPAGDRGPLEKQRERDTIEIIRKFRDAFGSGAGFVTLERRNPMFNQLRYASLGVQIPLSEFTEQYIATTFGGGDYVARGRTAGGTFQDNLRADFTIDHTIPPKNPLAPPVPKEAAPAAPPVDVAAIVREVRESARQENSAFVELAKAAMARPEPKSEIVALTELIKEIREESRKSEDRMLKLIERISARDPAPAPRSLLEQLEEAKELVDLIGGSDRRGGEGESWKEKGIDMLREALPLIAQKLAGGAPGAHVPAVLPAATLPVVAPPASPSSTAPASAPIPARVDVVDIAATHTAPAAAQPANEMTVLVQVALNQFRLRAIKAAQKGRDAFELVEDQLDGVPPQYLPQVFNVANKPDWFAQIFGADPEAMKHMSFLVEVRNSVLAFAFVEHVRRYAGQSRGAKETADHFLEWVSPDFHDALFNMTDPDNWSAAFDDPAGIVVPWLEQVRAALAAQLDSGNVETMPGVSEQRATNDAESQPGAVKSRVSEQGKPRAAK